MGGLAGQRVDHDVALGEGQEGGAAETDLSGQAQIVTELVPSLLRSSGKGKEGRSHRCPSRVPPRVPDAPVRRRSCSRDCPIQQRGHREDALFVLSTS